MDINSLANSYYMNSLWSSINPYSSTSDSSTVPLVGTVDQAASDTYENNLMSGEDAATQYQNTLSSMYQSLYDPSSAQTDSWLSPLGITSNIDPLIDSIDGNSSLASPFDIGGDSLTQELLGGSDTLDLLPFTSYLMNNPDIVNLSGLNNSSSIYADPYNLTGQSSYANLLDSYA